MPEKQKELPWDRPDWLSEISAWITKQVQRNGRQISGPVEILHQRPWAAFAQVPTNQGIVYFKAPAPTHRFEAGLTEALSRWRPDCTVPVLAVDRQHGWLLSAAAGSTLRSADQGVDQVAHWLEVLPLYAELQIEMAAHVPELLSLGLPDRRLARLPGLYARLLEDSDSLRVGLEPGLSAGEFQRLRDLQPQVSAMSQELAACGLPETLAHEEVTETNVIVGDGRYIFTDWSDCCVGQPFFTILVTLRTFVHWLKLEEEGPEIKRLRDLYLEPWTMFASWKTILTAFNLAYRLGMINRALSYQAAFSPLLEKHKAPYYDSIPGWLGDFLDPQISNYESAT